MTDVKIDEREFSITVDPSVSGYCWRVKEYVPRNTGMLWIGLGSGFGFSRWGCRWTARRFVRRLVRGSDRYRMTMTRDGR